MTLANLAQTLKNGAPSRRNITPCPFNMALYFATSQESDEEIVLDKMIEAGYVWFTLCWLNGIQPSGLILTVNGVQFSDDLENDPRYKASEG